MKRQAKPVHWTTTAIAYTRRTVASIAKLFRPPRRLRFTLEGKIFVGVTIGVGFAAVNTGNNLLYLVLGLLLSLVILSGVLSEITLRGLDFHRRLPRRAFVGTPALIEIEVHNRKRWAPSYSVEVEDQLDGRRTDKRCYFLKVTPDTRQTAAYRRVSPVRGVEHFVSLRVATRFPFGLFEKWREISMPDDHLVYPSPAHTGTRGLPMITSGETLSREERGHGEVDGVRDFIDGDPARDIHWPKTAALGRAVARERRLEGARAVRIEIANVPPREPGAGDEAPRLPTAVWRARLEDDIRRAAYVSIDALRHGASVQIAVEDTRSEGKRVLSVRPDARAADRVLAFLALLPPDAPIPEDSVAPRVSLPAADIPVRRRFPRPRTV